MDINTAVSLNTKRIREEKKLTLDAAAKATGVSRSMLAQIEKGDVNPTITVLWKIANGYKVSFTSLMEQPLEQTSLLKASALPEIREDEGRFINFPAFTFDDQRLFETFRIVIAPGGQHQSEAHLAGTEEYITVFEGCAGIQVGDATFTVNKGDSIRFLADTNHAYRNAGTTEAVLSMLIYYAK